MIEFYPCGFGLFSQPDVEFGPVKPASVFGTVPNTGAPVAHVLLHNALLPTAGHIAELGLEQVVARHGFEPGVDLALFACQHLIYCCLHIVINPALGNATKSFKRFCMRVKKHLMALAWIGHQPERTAGAKLGVRQIDAPPDAGDKGELGTPVKLKGFAWLEFKRNKRALGRAQALPDLPQSGKRTDTAVAAQVNDALFTTSHHLKQIA